MDSSQLELLKNASKDDESFAKLKKLFGDLNSEYDRLKGQLELLEAAVRDDYDSICITELDLEKPGPRIVYVNSGFEHMTGYSREEAIGQTPRMLQGPKTDRAVLDRLKQKLIDGQCFFGHTVNYKKDGTEFINQWDIHPLTNDEGEITHWVSYQRDISESNKSEKIIFDANIEMDDLREESRRTYIDLDEQGNILAANKAFREMTGYEVDEMKAIKIWDMIDESQRAEAQELFENMASNKVPKNKHNWTFKTKNGRKLLLETSMRWFINNDQDVYRIYMENLTMRNRILDALHLEDNGLEGLLTRKEEFTLKFVRNNDEIVVTHATDSFREITGFEPESIIGTMGLDLIEDEDRDLVTAHISKAFDGNCSTYRCRYKKADGEVINVIQHFNPAGENGENGVDVVKVTGILELEFED
jgi:PAS domain S-box-containing protein